MSLVIGRFEIVGELGKSELGSVYKAYDPTKNRSVALRVLPADTSQAIGASQQFLLQARAASALDSPNIVSIYAGAKEQGLVYVAMEYVEGVPLEAALATQQGFSSREVLDISRQVCRGLDHAHSKGVFHRLLTPDSILTEWDGTVKILDFAAVPGPIAEQKGDQLRYMSPEQVQGREPDARSNVFNWGAILYEIVTGRKAFGAGDPEGIKRQILETMPPPPNEVKPRVDVGISRAIMKALAKNPEYRFQRAGDMVSELEAECGAASRPYVREMPWQSLPLPRAEMGSPRLSPSLGGGPLSAPSMPGSEPRPRFAVGDGASAGAKNSVPVAVAPAPPNNLNETIAPLYSTLPP